MVWRNDENVFDSIIAVVSLLVIPAYRKLQLTGRSWQKR
jgi:hypothetical protein